MHSNQQTASGLQNLVTLCNEVRNNATCIWQNCSVFHAKLDLKVVLGLYDINIRAHVLLNLLNSLQKSDKMLDKPCILSLFPNSFNNSIKHEHSSKILLL